MRISRATSWFLLAFGVWSWLLWPTFVRNIWASERSWDAAGAATPYLIVHVIIGVVSLVLGTIIGVLGVRALRAARTGDDGATASAARADEPR